MPLADTTLFPAPKEIPDNMLVLMADIVRACTGNDIHKHLLIIP